MEEILTYDDAWIEEKKFNGKNLTNVIKLYPKHGNQLNDLQKILLSQSQKLINLKELDLNNQNLTDDFIKTISKNDTFSRIRYLNLINNKLITKKSLKYILNSNTLGSIRDLPSISGKYGMPISEIFININKANILEEDIKKYEKPRFDFSIHYYNSLTGETAPSVSNCVKILYITIYE